MASATLTPNGDAVVGSWINEAASSSNLYLSIDEPTASQNGATDIITTATQSSTYRCTLSDTPSDFSTIDSTVTLKVAANKATSKATTTITFSIVDSSGNALTGTSTPTLTTTYTVFSMTLTVTGATDKTTWDGAQIKMITGAGGSGFVNVTAAQLDITYTASGGGFTAKQTRGRGFRAGSRSKTMRSVGL